MGSVGKRISKYINLVILSVIVLAGALMLGVGLRTVLFASVAKFPLTLSPMQKMRGATVMFKDDKGWGTGVHIKNGLFLTARHVCLHFIEGETVALDYLGDEVKVKEVEMSQRYGQDLCAFTIERETEESIQTYPETPIADVKRFNPIGELVAVPGFGGSPKYSIQSGYIFAFELSEDVRGLDPTYAYIIGMQIFPGASGSGLFNKAGELVGILIFSNSMTVGGAMTLRDLEVFLGESRLAKEAGI
jgi:S1-C subfamily serine protease